MEQITSKKFKLLYSLTWVCFIISIVLKIVVYTTPPEKPIVPLNPVAKEAEQLTPHSSNSETSTNNSAKESPKKTSIILKATKDKDKGDNFDTEEIQIYQVDKPIANDAMQATITNLTVAKLSEDSMTSMDEKGAGIVDLSLSIENKSNDEIKIPVRTIKVALNSKEFPLQKKTPLEEVIQKGELREINLRVILPDEQTIDTVEKISFPLQFKQNKQQELFDVVIILK